MKTTIDIPADLTPEEAKKAREWALHALNKPGASNTAEKAAARVAKRRWVKIAENQWKEA